MDYVECDIDVKDISKLNKVIRFDTTSNKFTTTNGDLLCVPALSCHLPSADIWTFSPQAYHHLHGCSNELDGDKVVMHLKQQPDMPIRHDIRIPIEHHQSNLPIIANTAYTKKELDTIRPYFKSAMDSFNFNSLFTDHWNVEVDDFEY